MVPGSMLTDGLNTHMPPLIVLVDARYPGHHATGRVHQLSYEPTIGGKTQYRNRTAKAPRAARSTPARIFEFPTGICGS